LERHIPVATSGTTGIALALGALLIFGIVARLLLGPRGPNPGNAPEGTEIKLVGDGPDFQPPEDETEL
jgi:hypothetical protein